MKSKLFNTVLFLFCATFILQAQQSIVGHWEGAINLLGQQLTIMVDFKTSGDSIAGTIDIPQQGAKSLALRNIRCQQTKVYFELPAGPGLAKFDGELKADSIKGSFIQAGIGGSFNLFRGEIKKEIADAEPPTQYKPIVGVWNGAIGFFGQSYDITLDVKTYSGELKATIDIPRQGVKGLSLSNVKFESPKFHFEMSGFAGSAVFDGELSADSITGSFKQPGITGTFYLKKGERKKELATASVEEQVPYKQEEVVFHNDTIKLTGTLTLPQTKGPHPAVVMITGSGPQNRDEELLGFKVFKVIADHFTRNGIAVLRYDDRGVGGSTGNVMESTTEDFAKDVLAAVKFLKSNSDINSTRIGLCGHSEGGIVAPLAASMSEDVAFIIMMSGTGMNGSKIIIAQTEAIMRADSTSEDDIKEAIRISTLMHDAVCTDQGWDKAKSEIRKSVMGQYEKMSDEQKKAITNVDEYVSTLVDIQVKSLTTPWYKFFLKYEPAPVLEKVTCPVLVLFGELDLQVPAEMNEKPIEAALKKGKNKDYTIKIFPKANHLFQLANTGSPKEYATLKKEFVPEFLNTMTQWILKRVSVNK